MYQIGTDILKIDRIRIIEQENPSAFRRIFTGNEIEQAEKRKSRHIQYYATRFAAKEAVYKSLNLPQESKVDLNEIEILNHENGRPYVTLYGNIKTTAMLLGIDKIDVSVSYEDEYAVATALALRSINQTK